MSLESKNTHKQAENPLTVGRRVLVLTTDSEFYKEIANTLCLPEWLILPLPDEISTEQVQSAFAELVIVDHCIASINVLLLIREFRQAGLTAPVIYLSTSSYSFDLIEQLQDIFMVDAISLRRDFVAQLPDLALRLCQVPCHKGKKDYLPYFAGRNQTGSGKARRQSCRPGQVADQETLELIAALARDYISQMPEIFAQMHLGLETLVNDDVIAHDRLAKQLSLEEILNTAHQINGTGSSFGFIELGVVASLMEKRLQQFIESGEELSAVVLDEYLGYTKLMQGMCDAQIAELPLDVVAQCAGAAAVEGEVAQSIDQPLAAECGLPLVQSLAVDTDDAVRRIAVVSASDSPSGQAIKAVIAAQVLSGQSYQMVDANNALSAFTLIEEFKPELLIIEARLPGLNGLEACKMIRSHPQWKMATVLMLIESQDKSQSAFDSGADDYLVTPAEAEQTVDKLKALLSRSADKVAPVPARASWG